MQNPKLIFVIFVRFKAHKNMCVCVCVCWCQCGVSVSTIFKDRIFKVDECVCD